MSDELKPQATIDNTEFRRLVMAVRHSSWRFDGTEPEYDALIAHIDAWRSPTAIDAEEVASVIEGALVDDLLPYHSPEWIKRAMTLLKKLRS